MDAGSDRRVGHQGTGGVLGAQLGLEHLAAGVAWQRLSRSTTRAGT